MATLDDQPVSASAHRVRLVAFAFTVPLLTKLAYKPVGIVCGLVGARIAGKIFGRVWLTVAHAEGSPAVMDRDKGWGEVVAAAATKGVVFGTVKAVVDRAGAHAFERVTGTWPGHRTSAKQ